jgi:hypothetical protein
LIIGVLRIFLAELDPSLEERRSMISKFPSEKFKRGILRYGYA